MLNFIRRIFRNSNDPFPGPSENIGLGILLGIVYWVVVVGVFKFASINTIFQIAIVLIAFLGLHFAVRGCDFGSQYDFGKVGYFIKFFVLFGLGLAALLIGLPALNSGTPVITRLVSGLVGVVLLIPFVFWTGRGILRRVIR